MKRRREVNPTLTMEVQMRMGRLSFLVLAIFYSGFSLAEDFSFQIGMDRYDRFGDLVYFISDTEEQIVYPCANPIEAGSLCLEFMGNRKVIRPRPGTDQLQELRKKWENGIHPSYGLGDLHGFVIEFEPDTCRALAVHDLAFTPDAPGLPLRDPQRLDAIKETLDRFVAEEKQFLDRYQAIYEENYKDRHRFLDFLSWPSNNKLEDRTRSEEEIDQIAAKFREEGYEVDHTVLGRKILRTLTSGERTEYRMLNKLYGAFSSDPELRNKLWTGSRRTPNQWNEFPVREVMTRARHHSKRLRDQEVMAEVLSGTHSDPLTLSAFQTVWYGYEYLVEISDEQRALQWPLQVDTAPYGARYPYSDEEKQQIVRDINSVPFLIEIGETPSGGLFVENASLRGPKIAVNRGRILIAKVMHETRRILGCAELPPL